MATSVMPAGTSPQQPSSTKSWTRRLIIGMAIIAWIAIAGVAFWLIGLIASPLMLMLLSILIAYILSPMVKLFRRIMPNALAILLSYIVVLVVVVLFLYYVIWTAIAQLVSLIQSIQQNWPAIVQRLQPLVDLLQQAGVSQQQFQISGQQLVDRLAGIIGQLIPLASGVFSSFITIIIVTSLSVYFIVDGGRITRWLRTRTPIKQRTQLTYFLDILNRTMGNFLRGQILAATITTVIMGVGLWLIGVPYAMLLALVVFVFEFVPQIGSYISAAIIVIFAFITKGWQIGLIVAVFSGIVQGGIDGQILIPRILGGAVGLHPIVSMFALLVGATLFGLPGAILAAPVVGIAQIFLVSWWRAWKQAHPDDFPDEESADSPEEGKVPKGKLPESRRPGAGPLPA